MSDIKDYLHFYLGCEVQTPTRRYSSDGGKSYKVVGRLMDIDLVLNKPGVHLAGNHEFDLQSYDFKDLMIILRPLSELAEDEKLELYGMGFTCNSKGMQILHPSNWNAFNPSQFQYLVSKGFDIFNLHTKGLCLYRNEKGELI